MLCQERQEQISAYLDGELTGGELAAFREHLGGCADCRGELAVQERLWTLLGEVADPTVSLGLTRRIFAVTVGPGRQVGPRRHGVRWAVGLATAASVLIAGVVWHRINIPEPLDWETVAVIEKLDMLENLEVLENLDLLQAAAENPVIIEDPDTVDVVLGEGSS